MLLIPNLFPSLKNDFYNYSITEFMEYQTKRIELGTRNLFSFILKCEIKH